MYRSSGLFRSFLYHSLFEPHLIKCISSYLWSQPTPVKQFHLPKSIISSFEFASSELTCCVERNIDMLDVSALCTNNNTLTSMRLFIDYQTRLIMNMNHEKKYVSVQDTTICCTSHKYGLVFMFYRPNQVYMSSLENRNQIRLFSNMPELAMLCFDDHRDLLLGITSHRELDYQPQELIIIDHHRNGQIVRCMHLPSLVKISCVAERWLIQVRNQLYSLIPETKEMDSSLELNWIHPFEVNRETGEILVLNSARDTIYVHQVSWLRNAIQSWTRFLLPTPQHFRSLLFLNMPNSPYKTYKNTLN